MLTERSNPQGNPVRLSKAYKPLIVQYLPGLYNLDDGNVKLGLKDVPPLEQLKDEASKTRLGWKVAQLTGVTPTEPTPAPEPADTKIGTVQPPPDEYRYAIQGRLSGTSSLFVTPFVKLIASESYLVDFQGSTAANTFPISASTLREWKGTYFPYMQ